MSGGFQSVLAGWDGQAVAVRHDLPTGAWMFVALHDDTMGPPVGGIRMRVYERPEDGLVDATRLAAGMTYKWAAMELPFGGGKSVLAVPRVMEGEERAGLLVRFAGLLDSLNGGYRGGGDLGTTPADMALLSRHTAYIMGGLGEEAFDPGPFTALGVLCGIESAANVVFGTRELSGRSILVQGVGDVGRPLARLLAEKGATLMLADVDCATVESVAAECGGTIVEPGSVYVTSCDVYAPCALGATLNPQTIPGLDCRIVAGSANNQLFRPADGVALHERGILYTPDYVVNGGGAMAGGLIHLGVADVEELNRRVAGIGRALDRSSPTPNETASPPAKRPIDG